MVCGVVGSCGGGIIFENTHSLFLKAGTQGHEEDCVYCRKILAKEHRDLALRESWA